MFCSDQQKEHDTLLPTTSPVTSPSVSPSQAGKEGHEACMQHGFDK